MSNKAISRLISQGYSLQAIADILQVKQDKVRRLVRHAQRVERHKKREHANEQS